MMAAQMRNYIEHKNLHQTTVVITTKRKKFDSCGRRKCQNFTQNGNRAFNNTASWCCHSELNSCASNGTLLNWYVLK